MAREDAISRQYLLDNCVVDKVTFPYVPIDRIQNAPPVNQQDPCEKSVREKQAESERYDKAYEDGYDHGYAQARFDYEQEPCENCISRDAVLDLMQMKMSGKELYKAVYDLLPVTPKPKTGHWISIRNKNGTEIAIRCDCCGNSPKHAIRSDYCPNCGARIEA